MTLIFARQKYLQIKFSNLYPQTNNDGLKDTMGVTFRTAIISAIYKKCNKSDIENYRPILFLTLDRKIYTTTLQN